MNNLEKDIKIIEELIELSFKETLEKNPTFLLEDLNKIVDVKEIVPKDKVYTIPIENNKPLKVVLE